MNAMGEALIGGNRVGEVRNCQEPIRIGFMHGDPLYLQGLGELLKRQPGFEVLDNPGTSVEFSKTAAAASPDVVVLITGSHDRSAEEFICSIVGELPESRILLLTECEDLNALWRMFLIGVHACLAKSVQLDELVSTIRGIHRDPGRFVLSVGRTALQRLQPPAEVETVLTSRETQILELVANGASNIQIAKDLFITEATVKRHLSNAYAKLGVSSRFAAMNRAAELGILPRSPDQFDALLPQVPPPHVPHVPQVPQDGRVRV